MEHKVPRHVAIVMDGNGRWAENRGLARVEGHKAGVEAVKRAIQFCLEHKLPCLSLFVFSSENWSRPAEEVHFLMELFITSLRKEQAELHRQGICLRFTGDRSTLAPTLQHQMHEAETVTRDNKALMLNLVVNYGGKWDIVSAAKKIARDVQQGTLAVDAIDEGVFSRYLDTTDLPDPDLLIRTSGELRISNFFLWQLAYTELYFTEKCWPDFNAQEFDLALTSFAARTRRFGLV